MSALKKPSTQAIVGAVLKRAGFKRPQDVGQLGAIEVALRELGHQGDALRLCDLMHRKSVPPSTAVRIDFPDELELREYALSIGTGQIIFKIYGEVLIARPAYRAPTAKVVSTSHRQYGRIHNMFQGDVSGPQTIVCKDDNGYREVCVFNAAGGAWSDRMEAELQAVLKALQAVAS